MKIWYVYYQSPKGFSGMSTVTASTKAQAEVSFFLACPGYHIEQVLDR